jgi:hypothetical protein
MLESYGRKIKKRKKKRKLHYADKHSTISKSQKLKKLEPT